MNAHTVLTPLAVSAEPLLRAIQANPAATPKVLAEAAGRHANHIARDLKALEAAGLIALKPTELTGGGVAALEAIDRAKGEPRSPEPAQAAPEGLVTLFWAQIFPDPHNPRRDFDSEEAVEALEELAASIDDIGEVLQNLVVRPIPIGARADVEEASALGAAGPFYQLVAGERRWRAVGLLIQSGRRPETFPLPCKIRDLDDAKAKRWALIENLKRVDLKPMEEARAFKALVDDGMSTEAIAVEVLGHERKQRYVQQRIQLLELTEAQQGQVDAGKLTIKDALQILRNRPEPLELSLAERLLFLEVAERVSRKDSAYLYGDVPVDWPMHEAAQDPESDVAAMVHRGLLRFRYDYATGGSEVCISYDRGRQAFDQLVHGDLTPAAIAEPLALVRAEAKAAGLPPVTALNAPFLIDPVKADEAARREREQAERDASHQKRMDAFAAYRQQMAMLTADVETEARKFTPPPPLDDRFAAVMEQATAPLPWFFKSAPDNQRMAEILAANGSVVISGKSWGGAPAEDARLRMIVLATNAAAGLKTPSEAPAKAGPAKESPDDDSGDEDDLEGADGDGEFDEDEEG